MMKSSGASWRCGGGRRAPSEADVIKRLRPARFGTLPRSSTPPVLAYTARGAAPTRVTQQGSLLLRFDAHGGRRRPPTEAPIVKVEARPSPAARPRRTVGSRLAKQRQEMNPQAPDYPC
ncbi:hypothetical protein HPB50_008733 [Hyalomma asiaticum]|uniref:Uncharacterized protein n=1 Tax=Hyalomma asiaticum TaxID=266040 RepID=A0ACB7SG23_HYAAI|nr:hypothetical protein HPB50_008733 [Hyalomma asiaticum]